MSQETMNTVITSVVAPVLLLIAGMVMRYLDSKKKAQDATTANTTMKTTNETAWNVITLAERAVCTAVISVTQTYVDDLKATGSFGPEQQLAAIAKAKQAVYDTVKPDAIQTLNNTYQNVDKWIENQIELYVNRTKVPALAPVAAPAAEQTLAPVDNREEVAPVIKEVPAPVQEAPAVVDDPTPIKLEPIPVEVPDPPQPVQEQAAPQEQATESPNQAPNNSPIPDSPSV